MSKAWNQVIVGPVSGPTGLSILSKKKSEAFEDKIFDNKTFKFWVCFSRKENLKKKL